MCKSCGEENSIISVGAGIERIEEEVKEFFPNAKIALVTSDVISNFNAASELVKKISNNEVDIIIGTQMISKGYDFANITLVGIIDADSMLYSSNIRALERTYQILTQVAGRTGRRKEKGKVVIQTFNPDNFIFDKICNYDRDSFYEFEANNREILDLPPFSRIIKLEVSSFKEFEAKNFAKKLIQHFPCSDKIEILGPAPSPIQKLKNRHHFLINIKASRKVNLQKLIKDVILSIQTPNSIRIRIDVDPV
jgi:primosomal protein N' (replication factor Y)